MTMRKVKKKMGRPPKRPSDRLTECIMVRATKAEHKILEKETKRLGIPLATLLMLPWRKQQR